MTLKSLISLIIIATLFVSACTQQITVTPQPERNTLSVSGEGILDVNPDKAEITISIVTNSSTAQTTQHDNRERSNRIINALLGSGVKQEDIETMDYDLQHLYGWRDKTGERVDQGYQLSHRIKITTTNLEQAGALVDLAINSGANQVDSISFGLTRSLEEQVKTQALAKASQEAARKAQAIASNIQVTLGKIVKASESAEYQPYYAPAGRMYASEGAAPEPSIISPQKLSVRATVAIEYEIK